MNKNLCELIQKQDSLGTCCNMRCDAFHMHDEECLWGEIVDLARAPLEPVAPAADDSTIQRLTLAEALLQEIRTTLFLQPDMVRSDTGERGDGELGEFIGRINRLLGDQKVGCPDCNGYIGYSHADDCPRNGE